MLCRRYSLRELKCCKQLAEPRPKLSRAIALVSRFQMAYEIYSYLYDPSQRACFICRHHYEWRYGQHAYLDGYLLLVATQSRVSWLGLVSRSGRYRTWVHRAHLLSITAHSFEPSQAVHTMVMSSRSERGHAVRLWQPRRRGLHPINHRKRLPRWKTLLSWLNSYGIPNDIRRK